MRFFIVWFFAIFSFIPAAYAQDYKSEIENAETLGRLIYEQDVAGWVATDSLLKDKKYLETVTPNLKGWLSYQDGKNYKTIFVGVYDGVPKAVYEVKSKARNVKNSQKIIKGRSLSSQEVRLWKARQKVVSENFEHCPEYTPMNTIVLPIPNDPEQRLYGYLFSATTISGKVVFGKHYRFTLSSDASKVLEKRDFSKSCIAVNRSEAEQTVGVMISHIMRPYPEEHHVFANLSQELDVYITIPETSQLWRVGDGKISKVKR